MTSSVAYLLTHLQQPGKSRYSMPQNIDSTSTCTIITQQRKETGEKEIIIWSSKKKQKKPGVWTLGYFKVILKPIRPDRTRGVLPSQPQTQSDVFVQERTGHSTRFTTWQPHFLWCLGWNWGPAGLLVRNVEFIWTYIDEFLYSSGIWWMPRL